jgi:transposase
MNVTSQRTLKATKKTKKHAIKKDAVTIGIDTAKSVFQIHGVDVDDNVALRKRVNRNQLMELMAQLPAAKIGIEATGASHHWARELIKLGHDVRLMNPKKVKAYRDSDKSDRNDAEAICEAVSRKKMKFIAVKTLDQQGMQGLHRGRSRLVKNRTALVNQARGLLGEFGIVMNKGIRVFRSQFPEKLYEQADRVPEILRVMLQEMYNELLWLDEQIDKFDKQFERLTDADSMCRKLKKLRGIGPLSALALVSKIGDAHVFKNGRELSSYFGIVPQERSSGDTKHMFGISKRGDRYLRTLLIHGARSVVWNAEGKDDALSVWINKIKAKSGANVAAVALANKNVRIVWAMMTKDEEYREAA